MRPSAAAPVAAPPIGEGPSFNHGHLTQPVLAHLNRVGVHSVLDLGCGNGWFTQALARCGFEAVGVDRCAAAVAHARRHYPDVEFHAADVALPLDGALQRGFDAIVAIELFDHVAEPHGVLRHALAALRPGGCIVATVPYHGYLKNLGLALTGRLDLRWQALEDRGRVKFYSPASFTRLMQECGVEDLQMVTAGRFAPFARSMVLAGRVASGVATP